MSSLREYVAVEVNGEEVSLYDVLKPANLWGRLEFLQDAIDSALIRQNAAERGLEVSDEELQHAADDFRSARDLNDAKATEEWLVASRLSYEEGEALLEQYVLSQKLRDLITADQAEQRFVEQRLSFDRALIARMVVKEEGVARELRAQIVDDGADFHALAREFSIDDATRLAGGYAGEVRRGDLEPALEAAVFGRARAVVGPIKTDDGWQLVKVESVKPATLDDSLREKINAQLFAEWLSEQRRKARIRIPLLEETGESEQETDVD